MWAILHWGFWGKAGGGGANHLSWIFYLMMFVETSFLFDGSLVCVCQDDNPLFFSWNSLTIEAGREH